MIKTFEQFVSTIYGRPVNESFQSSKLREIIKQHGKPKYSWDKKMLYDLKDDEIVDVLDSRKEYWKKYPNDDIDKREATFMLELEDGSVIVISNLGILKSYWYPEEVEKQKEAKFKKRHSERHKGNLGKGGDEIHKKHLEKVDEIERRRFAEKLQPNIQEIVDAINDFMDNINTSDIDCETNENYDEIEITLNGEEYIINIYYDCSVSDSKRKYGAEYYDVYYSLNSFEICSEDTCITNDELGVTPKTHGELFKEYIEKDIEGDIYDYYDYYGVSPSDFY